jgi:hypothetical protein
MAAAGVARAGERIVLPARGEQARPADGARRQLVQVGDTVVVRVGLAGVGAVAVFVEQAEAVTVGVPDGVGRRGGFAGV